VEYAPSTDLSLPSALAPMVTAVLHVSTFRPHAMSKRSLNGALPAYTTANNGQHFLTPKDVATMYDVNSTYSAGFTGAGQTVAIAGETYIQLSDVANFQTATGLTANPPKLVLQPNTGGSAIYEGDEFESDIDVEYATGMAPGANVLLVYTGDSPNYSVFDAFDYAIEENLAPVVSISYGSCEPGLSSSFASAGNLLFEQAAAQGQTLIASAGDSGSTECFGYTDNNGNPEPASFQERLAINFPADSPYVTSIGGTQMQAGTFGAGASQYWANAGGTAVPDSLLSYVPETVWNEDSAMYGLASGGGGTSIYFSAPTWQAGIPGIASTNTARLNPDISFQASVDSPGYLACSSDPSAFATGQTSSCVNGIYDSTKKFVTSAGGTSFGAPIFAGLMAVLNQAKHGTGQGPVNPTVYGLAKSTTTYASVFHDITTGNNECTVLGAANCSVGSTSYAATVGYDQASGLGSIDFGNMLAAWPASTASALSGTSTVLTAATNSPASGASDLITITVKGTGSATPTGTVQVYVANEAPAAGAPSAPYSSTPTPVSVTLTNGVGTYTYQGTTVGGTQVITAVYSGDAANASSTGTIALTLANTQTPSGSFTFSAGAVTVPVNNYGYSTLTITPTGGYNGLVNFTSSSLPAGDCFLGTDYSGVTGTPLQINVYFGNGTECTSATGAAVRIGNHMVTLPKRTAKDVPPVAPGREKEETILAAGLLGAGLLWRRRKARRVPSLLALAALTLVAGMGLSGCGGSSVNAISGTGGGTAQTLTVTLTGTDSVTPSISASSAVTVNVQ